MPVRPTAWVWMVAGEAHKCPEATPFCATIELPCVEPIQGGEVAPAYGSPSLSSFCDYLEINDRNEIETLELSLSECI